MLNKVILIGRLTRDPELRYTPNTGSAVASFTLAVDRAGSNKGEADFINIVVWNKQAELCAQYLVKGRLAAVVGRLQIRTFEKDGKRQYFTEVVAETVRFLDSKSASSGDDTTAPERRNFDEFAGSDTITEDEDVPF